MKILTCKKKWFSIIMILVLLGFNSANVYGAAFDRKKVNGVMATAVGTEIAVTFEKISGASGYLVYESTNQKQYYLAKDTTGTKVVFTGKEKGRTYYYYVVAYQIKKSEILTTKKSVVKSTTVSKVGTSTIKNFLQTAMSPVGSTMYVWGGGWNKADTGAGADARHVGLSARWRSFANMQNKNYNYKLTRYQIHDGLDCSGFVGWCIYNVRHTRHYETGYVYSASKQAITFAQKGWGSYTTKDKVRNHKAGDIMCSAGHVYICIGECEDGSVVLVHASPCGVQISGTVAKSGNCNSQAHKLAKKYMKRYYPNWYEKYGCEVKPMSYLTDYSQMRWKSNVLSDPDAYQKMHPEKILKDLFRLNW